MEATTGQLGISDMAGIFVVFTGSIVLASCALIVEYLYAACSDSRLDKSKVCGYWSFTAIFYLILCKIM